MSIHVLLLDRDMLIVKPVRTQLLELSGEISFEKGLYHNQAYESLMKEVKGHRSLIAFIKE